MRVVLARNDKKLGPRLQAASDADMDCAAGPLAIPPANKDAVLKTPPCGVLRGAGRFSARGLTMAALALALAGNDSIVFDETGLEGAFNADLEWTPDDMSATSPDGQISNALSGGAAELPGYLTAVQEQLGLKLETVKDPVDVLVIDHIERPTEN
jgi:uncharacterized protein (TIGR03435 family)